MHVFCPNCNAEYKVNERSSLTKTVKFVCIECGGSWVDKFEKIEKEKEIAFVKDESSGNITEENTNKETGKMELNTLALEEVQNSFGNKNHEFDRKYNEDDIDHIFQFETIEEDKDINETGPSKTLPTFRNEQEDSSNENIEERDAKEIEIEKRLKESSELLKKAKQPHSENKENISKEKKPKTTSYLVILSILLIFSLFTYNLTILFLEDILLKVPFAPEILSQISKYAAIFQDILITIFENLKNFIPNLV